MNICVLMLVKIPKRLDDRARLLRSRGAIKINQRMPMCLFAQNREILANSVPVQTAARTLVHPTICSTRRYAPTHSCGCPSSTRDGVHFGGGGVPLLSELTARNDASLELRNSRPILTSVRRSLRRT